MKLGFHTLQRSILKYSLPGGARPGRVSKASKKFRAQVLLKAVTCAPQSMWALENTTRNFKEREK